MCFLGYTATQKGYRSQELSLKRIIISRDDTFQESGFPFASKHLKRSPAVNHVFHVVHDNDTISTYPVTSSFDNNSFSHSHINVIDPPTPISEICVPSPPPRRSTRPHNKPS